MRRKVTKAVISIMSICIVFYMVPMMVFADGVDVAQSQVVTRNTEEVNNNYGTIERNAARVNNNYSRVDYNSFYVQNNYGAIYANECTVNNNQINGTVSINDSQIFTNYGMVETNNFIITDNFGTVEENGATLAKVINNYGGTVNNGRVTNQFREVTITGANPDQLYSQELTYKNGKTWVQINVDGCSSSNFTLTPYTGYHFTVAPIAEGCIVVENDDSYVICDVDSDVHVIVNVMRDYDHNPDPETPDSPLSFESDIRAKSEQIRSAKAGDTVTLVSDTGNAYPLSLMQQIKNRRDIDIVMSYNYKGYNYRVFIPRNATVELDENIPWYGPLKIAEMFGAVKTPVK